MGTGRAGESGGGEMRQLHSNINIKIKKKETTLCLESRKSGL